MLRNSMSGASPHGFLAGEITDEQLPCMHNKAAQQSSGSLTPIEHVDIFGHCIERHILPKLSEFVHREAENAANLANRLDMLIQAGVSKLEENKDRLARLSDLIAVCNATLVSYRTHSSPDTKSCRGFNSARNDIFTNSTDRVERDTRPHKDRYNALEVDENGHLPKKLPDRQSNNCAGRSLPDSSLLPAEEHSRSRISRRTTGWPVSPEDRHNSPVLDRPINCDDDDDDDGDNDDFLKAIDDLEASGNEKLKAVNPEKSVLCSPESDTFCMSSDITAGQSNCDGAPSNTPTKEVLMR